MEDSKKELQRALEHWSEVTQKNTENNFRKLLIRVVLGATRPLDLYSSWAMGGVAGGLVSILASLNEVSTLIGASELKATLILLCLSILFGVMQKGVSAAISISQLLESEAELAFQEAHAAHQSEEKKIKELATESGIEVNTEIDFQRAFYGFVDLYPSIVRWQILGHLKKLESDPAYIHRRMLLAYIRQVIYVSFQVILGISAVVIVATNI